jgi:hypothetical protein
MSTGFKGLNVRKKSWSANYGAGTHIAYTIPNDVLSAKVFIQTIEGDNIDNGESIFVSAERLVKGAWRSIGGIASLSNPIGGQANEEIALYVQYENPSESNLKYTPLMYESVSSFNPVSVGFQLLDLKSGDRIKVVVNTSGETFDVLGYIEETAGTVTSI